MEKFNEQLKKSKNYFENLPWESKDSYGSFLAQTYYFVCHSTRLLALSISHFKVDRDDLYRRFIAHIKEENYHERLALADLKNLGYALDDFPELPATKAFWECQYYKVNESKGTSLLGYILYLEAIATHCFQEIYQRLKISYGDKACSFIRLHVTEDPEHVRHALEHIETLAQEQQMIWDNFEQTAVLYHYLASSAMQYEARSFVGRGFELAS